MEELILAGLGIYLYNRLRRQNSPFKVGNVPPIIKRGNDVKVLDRRDIPLFEEKACPWNWYPWKRPEMYNDVPLSPGSRDRWRTSCDYWKQIRTLGRMIDMAKAELKTDQVFITDFITKRKDAIAQNIKEKKDQQAFLLSETKRIAQVQKRTEARYKQALANTFSEDEIKAFYQTRKDQIADRIWPYQDTQVVPVVSPGPGGLSSDAAPIDTIPTDVVL